jgi:hypothetical protein
MSYGGPSPFGIPRSQDQILQDLATRTAALAAEMVDRLKPFRVDLADPKARRKVIKNLTRPGPWTNVRAARLVQAVAVLEPAVQPLVQELRRLGRPVDDNIMIIESMAGPNRRIRNESTGGISSLFRNQGYLAADGYLDTARTLLAADLRRIDAVDFATREFDSTPPAAGEDHIFATLSKPISLEEAKVRPKLSSIQLQEAEALLGPIAHLRIQAFALLPADGDVRALAFLNAGDNGGHVELDADSTRRLLLYTGNAPGRERKHYEGTPGKRTGASRPAVHPLDDRVDAYTYVTEGPLPERAQPATSTAAEPEAGARERIRHKDRWEVGEHERDQRMKPPQLARMGITDPPPGLEFFHREHVSTGVVDLTQKDKPKTSGPLVRLHPHDRRVDDVGSNKDDLPELPVGSVFYVERDATGTIINRVHVGWFPTTYRERRVEEAGRRSAHRQLNMLLRESHETESLERLEQIEEVEIPALLDELYPEPESPGVEL